MACKTPCDACKPGDLPILFTRYAATFSADATRAAALKKLKPVGEFKAPPIPLKTASYAVRMLREGVLYVLVEREGRKKWMGYMVHPHGYLSPFNPLLTPAPAEPASPACEVVIRGASKSLVWVPDPTSVTNLWYFFHPDAVLLDVLQKLEESPADLPRLDIAAWARKPVPQSHTCGPSELPIRIAEWAALNDGAMLAGLNEQLYGVMGIETVEQGYGEGQVPIYVNAALKQSRTDPPSGDIFSADNPWGHWRRTERMGPGTLPSYADVHRERLQEIARVLAGDPSDPKKPLGVVAACPDAIGIAQEMNHWRNKPYRDLILWGDVVDNAVGAPTVTGSGAPPPGNKQSRKTRFEIADGWKRMEALFKQRRIAYMSREIEASERATRDPVFLEDKPTKLVGSARSNARVFDSRADYIAYLKRIENAKGNSAKSVNSRWDEYALGINLDAMEKVQADYVEKAKAFEGVAHERAPDSLAWLNCGELQRALALYNGKGRSDIEQGAKCAAQINGILEGLNGGGALCEQRLMAWAKDHSDEPKNLLWRGYLMNQEDAQESFRAAMAAAQAPATSVASMVQSFKDQLDKFAKFNDLIAGRNDASIRICRAIPIFGFSPILNLIGHAVFKAGSGTIELEKRLARSLMMSLVAGTGSPAAIELHARYRRALKDIEPEKFRIVADYQFKWSQQQLKAESHAAINKIMAEGRGGDFFKMRLTGVMTLVEGILLSFKAKQLADAKDVDSAQKAAWELSAAALTTTSAGLEVGAMTQEWLIAKSAPYGGTLAMAEIRLGGFKLAGNALAGIAGIVSACLDYGDGKKSRQEEKYALTWLFFGRGAAHSVNFAVGIALGFSYTGPLMEHLARSVGFESLRGRALQVLAARAAALALGRTALLAANLWVTLTILAATWIIGQLGDNEIQKWIKRSSFRLPPKPGNQSEPLYEKAGEELTALYIAFKVTEE